MIAASALRKGLRLCLATGQREASPCDGLDMEMDIRL